VAAVPLCCSPGFDCAPSTSPKGNGGWKARPRPRS
jgi:hypothetical protein